MAVVRHAGRKRRAIVKGKRLLAFGQLELSLKGIDLPPVLEDLFLFLGKADGHVAKTQDRSWIFPVRAKSHRRRVNEKEMARRFQDESELQGGVIAFGRGIEIYALDNCCVGLSGVAWGGVDLI